MRLFLIYAIVELAVIVALASTIGFGWTVLLLLAAFVAGLALAGSQLKRHLQRLQSGLAGTGMPGGGPAAVSDSLLVALGAVLVVVPGLASSLLGGLLLLPPSRRAARPLVAAVVTRYLGRTVPLITVTGARQYPGYGGRTGGHGDYIDGEVVDVTDVDPAAVERKPD